MVDSFWDGKWHAPVNGEGTKARHKVSINGSSVIGTNVNPEIKNGKVSLGDVDDQRNYEAHHQGVNRR